MHRSDGRNDSQFFHIIIWCSCTDESADDRLQSPRGKSAVRLSQWAQIYGGLQLLKCRQQVTVISSSVVAVIIADLLSYLLTQ
jgi:hypothetical protein